MKVNAPIEMLACVRSAIISAQTAIAIKDASSGPERTNLDGYSGAYASKHINVALKELQKARDLLEPVAQAAQKEEAVRA